MNPFYIENVRQKTKEIPFHYHIDFQTKPCVYANPHIHEYIEILFCHSGCHKVSLNQITHSLREGDMIVINPNMVHTITMEEPGSYSVVQFSPEFLYSTERSVIEPKYILPFIQQDTASKNHFSENDLSETDIPNIISRIVQEYNARQYGYEFALKICAEQLFLWILRTWNSQGLSLAEAHYDEKWSTSMNHVLDYVWKHYDQNISAAEMAKMCYVTYGHFSAVFKKMTGSSFVKYLNNVRIMQSKKQLLKTSQSITEIAQSVGFSTSSYYIEQFKRTEGISPYQYRLLNT